ncbi:biotin carboxyl carrier domain-containing protein [Rhodobacteraceae bacterium B1Z28]|uniref:Biotin carboxyl carrier protein of acetyl-CoA carboxylase n=1 Tax=Ruegeria haliotis TaxID=2747601 RepID=A0ABX2PWG9_9RHOB|nr:acetyl-CoA carboxylase [Ruegeria haliotis]NVO58530.1 biotin carboxyl carrier domain-containing protein [Ruegeria haliotis]
MADIKSPVPGTFYTQATPDAPVYKAQGDTVTVGDVIGLVEVMKTFIEIKSDMAGTFAGYAVENEAAVSAGQTLAQLDG